MRKWLIIGMVIGVAVVGGSRFYPTVDHIEVHGNRHYSALHIAHLANVSHGDPLLWVTRQSAEPLFSDQWIHSAVITRTWPNKISIHVYEEIPVLSDGTNAWSESGTLLSGGSHEELAALPILAGWGPSRVLEAVQLHQLLRVYVVEKIEYSPAGFDITLAGSTMFTPSVDALERQWGAFVASNGNRVAVYPWGVSVTDEQ